MADRYDIEMIRENVRRLLDWRKRSSFEVSETLGRNRTYLDDFLRGRKGSLSAKITGPLSDALGVSTIYINGISRVPDNANEIQTREKLDADWLPTKIKIDATHSPEEETEEDKEPYAGSDRVKLFGVPELVIVNGIYPLPLLQHELRIYFKKDVREIWDFPNLLFVEHNTIKSYVDLIMLEDDLPNAGRFGYRRGDRVLVDRLNKNVRRDGVFVLREGDYTVVRQVSPMRGGDTLMLQIGGLAISHTGSAIAADDVQVIGRVIMLIVST